jgi:hypothetical protein
VKGGTGVSVFLSFILSFSSFFSPGGEQGKLKRNKSAKKYLRDIIN